MFAGQYRDAESGLYYLHARYYEPATAQFLTRDPLAPQTGEPFVYVRGNPLNSADPTGLFQCSDLGAGFYTDDQGNCGYDEQGAYDARVASLPQCDTLSGQAQRTCALVYTYCNGG